MWNVKIRDERKKRERERATPSGKVDKLDAKQVVFNEAYI